MTFRTLLEQKGEKNTSKIATLIFLTISIQMRMTRLLEIGPSNTNYDMENRSYKECTIADYGNKGEIKAMAAENDEDYDDKDSLD